MKQVIIRILKIDNPAKAKTKRMASDPGWLEAKVCGHAGRFKQPLPYLRPKSTIFPTLFLT